MLMLYINAVNIIYLTIGKARKVIKSLSSFSSIPKCKYWLIYPCIKQVHDRIKPEQSTIDENQLLHDAICIDASKNYFKTIPQIAMHHKTLNVNLCMYKSPAVLHNFILFDFCHQY